ATACGREEELGAAPLLDRQSTVVAGDEPVPVRVPGDHGSHEARRGPQDGQIVDEDIQVPGGCVLGGLLGKRVLEELHISVETLKLGGLGAQHPMSVEQQQGDVFLRRMPERVETAGRGIGLACEPAQQEAVVEGESDHARRISRHAVQAVESAGSEQLKGRRELTPQGRAAYDDASGGLIDVRERGKLVHQRVTGGEWGRPHFWEVGPGPPARDEVPKSIGVAPPLAAYGEVEERARPRRRLAEVAGTAGSGLFRRGDATEVREYSGGSDRIVEEQFPQIALGLGSLEGRVKASIGKAWRRDL